MIPGTARDDMVLTVTSDTSDTGVSPGLLVDRETD
jgi:hypothetical protein